MQTTGSEWKNNLSKYETARIRNRYNQVPHRSQDTKWESSKIIINMTNKSQEVSPFPSGDHKAAMNRRESMINTRQLRVHDAKMQVTYEILEHYHAFYFFQQPFFNGMCCSLNSLRHIVITKVSFDS